jgi:predicted negative regulator of RcsB-dependent stress response
MFEYQLRGGLNALALGELETARQRLTRANQSVPTSIAYLRLGDIAVRQGRRAEAITAYRQAAQSDDEIGAEARQKLAELTQ